MPAPKRFLAALLSLLMLIGCSGNKEAAKPTPTVADASTSPANNQLAAIPAGASLEDTLEFYINEAMTKLHYGDKTALYENELRYYTDEHDFDSYLKAAEVKHAEADSLTHVEVLSVQKFPTDSLYVGVRVNFIGKKGTASSIVDTVPMFFSGGRWKRPLVSKYINEVQYEKLIHEAEKDAGK